MSVEYLPPYSVVFCSECGSFTFGDENQYRSVEELNEVLAFYIEDHTFNDDTLIAVADLVELLANPDRYLKALYDCPSCEAAM